MVFNQEDSFISEDMTVIHNEAQSEGEKEKIIQAPQDNTEDVEKPKDKDSANQQTCQVVTEPHQSSKLSNSVSFPSADDSQHENNHETLDKSQPTEQHYGHGQTVKHKNGHYKTLNEGCVAAITAIIDETQDNDVPEPPNNDNKLSAESYELLPDIALASHAYLDPKTLDEALRGPNAKQWQEALEYEISQLKKLGTWTVVDLPPGQMAIPCSEVIRVK
jgi:hypothetical protein